MSTLLARLGALALLALTLTVVTTAACGDDPASPDAPTTTIDAGVDAGTIDASCFEDPQTYLEIINACTDAVKIDKQPVLPLLNADGSLPPLPE